MIRKSVCPLWHADIPSDPTSESTAISRQLHHSNGHDLDLDVAAPRDETTHVPASGFITHGSLERAWSGFVWMNPPFGGRNGLKPWLDKFFQHGNGIALTPDRTSAPWFHEAWTKAHLVLFTPKLRFIRPDGTDGKFPSNGTALWAAGDQASVALRAAADRKLGILADPISR